MDTIKVYDDGETKIELLKTAAEQLNERSYYYKLDPIMMEELLVSTCEYLEIDGGEIIVPEKVIIIHRNDQCRGLESCCECLTEAYFLLVDSFDMTEGELTKKWRLEVSILISLYYSLQGLGDCKVLFINDARFKDITGILTYLKEDKTTILMPFILDDKGKFQRLY